MVGIATIARDARDGDGNEAGRPFSNGLVMSS